MPSTEYTALGLLLVLVAVALLAGQTWARVVAVILVILNAVGALLLIPAQPWWSMIVIAIDILVIYAPDRPRPRTARRELAQPGGVLCENDRAPNRSQNTSGGS